MGVTWVLMFWTGEGGGGNLGPDVLDSLPPNDEDIHVCT